MPGTQTAMKTMFAALLCTASPALSQETKLEDKPSEPEERTEKKDEFQIKPRWRIQYDIADVDGPDGLTSNGQGGSEKLRRAYIGVDAKFGGGLSARAELEFATPDPEFTDLYLSYDRGPLNVKLGQYKPFTSLDDMTSDLYTSFAERAAFVNAFNQTRRTGASVSYTGGQFMVAGSVSTDLLITLNDADSNSLGLDMRAIWMPKFDKTQLHLGGSIHWRDRNDLAPLGVLYRHRPFTRTIDTRFVSTPNLIVEKELSYGVEAAVMHGPFHFASEAHWLRASRPSAANVGLFGGYAEVGFMLTPGDTRSYSEGAFGGIKPNKPVGSGGFGTLQVNLRYDYLDLNDADTGITGGKQKGYQASLIWVPIENVRILGNYARLDYRDAVIPLAGGSRNYGVDVFVVRFQVHY